MTKSLKWITAIAIAVGLALHVGVAFRFQTRAWIDEIWVVCDPAFRLWSRPLVWPVGQVSWNLVESGMRSWIAPSFLFLLLKMISFLGITRGSYVLAVVRIVIALVTFAAKVVFAFKLKSELNLKSPPLLALLVLIFTPEFIHYSGTADLSVLGLPVLLLGLSLIPWRETRQNGQFFDDQPTPPAQVGGFLLCLASLIRFQYGVFPAVWLAWLAYRKKWRYARELVATGIGVLCATIAFDSLATGQPTFALFSYFYKNTAGGMAAGYGVTPFYYGFELLWRFITEPTFLAFIVTATIAARRIPFLFFSTLIFFAIHCFVGHKEYRFFYGVGILLAAQAGACLQLCLQEYSGVFLVFFAAGALWRAEKKVSWAEFEIPSRLETLAGEQPDIKGLIVSGWNGVHTGGLYTFHKDLPYVFSPNRARIKELAYGTSPRKFNYVIVRTDEPAPCKESVVRLDEAALFRCTETEIESLFTPS